MNKIQKLIQELCPNGVEYKPLCEVCHSKHLGEKSASPCDSKLSPCHSEALAEESKNIESLKSSKVRDISGVSLPQYDNVPCHSERSEESQNIESLKSSKSANLSNAKNAQSHFKSSLTNSSQPYKIPHFSFSQRKSNPSPLPLPKESLPFFCTKGEPALNPLLVKNQTGDTSAPAYSDFSHHEGGADSQNIESKKDSKVRDISGVSLPQYDNVPCHSKRSEESQNIESLKDSNKMFRG
ncbi:hypothetical protein ACRE1U_04360 [Helicobacter himalayensis]|uniref:hypothetical protein n=1 Tax=Helicobacter himalayensis TaxID=1591088 RepID=UPI003D6EA0BA